MEEKEKKSRATKYNKAGQEEKRSQRFQRQPLLAHKGAASPFFLPLPLSLHLLFSSLRLLLFMLFIGHPLSTSSPFPAFAFFHQAETGKRLVT